MPSQSTINIFEPAVLIDPYDAYRELRGGPALHYVPEMNVHVATRYEVIREIIRDTKTFSSEYAAFFDRLRAAGIASASPAVRSELEHLEKQIIPPVPTMLTLDEPGHTRYRSLVSALFTAKETRKSEAAVRAVVDETIVSLGNRDSVEFVESFAAPIPLKVIGQRLGIPEDDVPLFNRGATAAASGLRLTPLTGDQMIERAKTAVDLQGLLVRLIEERRSTPTEDMISILANSKLEDENRYLEHGETLSILGQFLVAGHETTTSAFGWAMLLLCKNPEIEDQIASNPKLLDTFVEEALRLEAPVQGLPRLVTKDTQIEDYALKAGDIVFLRYGSANRDERKFDDADSCDLHRKKAGAHFAFGGGVHACIGAPLSRQELTLGWSALLQHGKNFRLSEGRPEPEAEMSFILRNLPALHIDFELR
ncbi:MAG: cytochrome P450 [Parasphingorhabdus sp.]|uniref:cytochrome P450 n=1 Tax=Parasphingorhabdus sp. TaxID=2709688 RepID=UPI003298A0DE